MELLDFFSRAKGVDISEVLGYYRLRDGILLVTDDCNRTGSFSTCMDLSSKFFVIELENVAFEVKFLECKTINYNSFAYPRSSCSGTGTSYYIQHKLKPSSLRNILSTGSGHDPHTHLSWTIAVVRNALRLSNCLEAKSAALRNISDRIAVSNASQLTVHIFKAAIVCPMGSSKAFCKTSLWLTLPFPPV